MKNTVKTAALIIVVLVLVLSFALPSFATGDEIIITNADELGDAIANQADGQIWRIKPGTYDLDATQLAKYADIRPAGANSDWYFPIIRQISIIGEDNPLITSSVEIPNGALNTQDLISVWADNVSIEGVKILSKREINKAIEVVTGKNFTLKNVEILPQQVSDEEDYVFSGSIYFHNDLEDHGNTVIENVKVAGHIRTGTSSEGTVTLKNVEVDYCDSYHGFNNNFSPLNGTSLVAEDVTVLINNNSITDISKYIINTAPQGITIKLNSDIEIKQQLYINNTNITIDGNGYTITASDDFTNYSTDPSTHPTNLVSMYNSSVVLQNVNLINKAMNKHTLNVVESDLILDNVKLDNQETTGGAPLINNSSTISVNNNLELVVGENSWYGINLDNKTGEDTTLTFEEGSKLIFNQDTDKAMIYIDGENLAEVINPTNAGIVVDEETGVYRTALEISSLELNKTQLTLEEGETDTLVLTINPEDADILTDIVWTSSNPEVATVEAGEVVALAAGNTTITVTVNGVSIEAEVTVTAEPAETDPTTTEPIEEQPNGTGDDTASRLFIYMLAFIISGAIIVILIKRNAKAVN